MLPQRRRHEQQALGGAQPEAAKWDAAPQPGCRGKRVAWAGRECPAQGSRACPCAFALPRMMSSELSPFSVETVNCKVALVLFLQVVTWAGEQSSLVQRRWVRRWASSHISRGHCTGGVLTPAWT